MVDNIIKREREWQHKILNDNEETEAINTVDASTDISTLILPYGGNKGDDIISKMKKNISNLLTTIPTGNKSKMLRVIYKSKKLSSKFQIKDNTKFKHMHNIVYHGKCHDKSCNSHYGGQTKCRIEKRVIQHNRTDINSYLLKHANEVRHERVWLEDFKVLDSGYSSDFKRKISESLFINELKPDLNVQKTAFKLSLFN